MSPEDELEAFCLARFAGGAFGRAEGGRRLGATALRLNLRARARRARADVDGVRSESECIGVTAGEAASTFGDEGADCARGDGVGVSPPAVVISDISAMSSRNDVSACVRALINCFFFFFDLRRDEVTWLCASWRSVGAPRWDCTPHARGRGCQLD